MVSYQFTYSVGVSNNNITKGLINFLKTSKYIHIGQSVKIESQSNIDNRKYVLFYINKKLAYAELKLSPFEKIIHFCNYLMNYN